MIMRRRLLPDMRVLMTFECAARHGNFTKAAEELAMTQSAVSRQMRELEEQIGKDLFERLPGRVVPNRAGRELLPEVQRLLRMAESTMRHAAAGAAGETVLAVNALPTFATRWLMPRLPAYLARRPDISVDLTTSGEVFDLDERQCDVAIHFGQPIWPGGTATYLCSEIIVPVVGGALRERAIDGPEALADVPRLHLSERPWLWSDWFARLELEPGPIGAGHWFDQFALIIEAVRGGLGCALLPRYLIERELASGELKVALDIPYSTDMAYYIIVPEGRAGDAADFRDWLVGEVSFRPLAG
ncbi:LysR family transcriptional regulator [Acuticoccus kandeliae]|uniref:LysR family transcriptional regulator n=1 Tax=Acuticoccus kandeliae TaxID=2073160 RepID=UPI000D3E07DD|nr:LysR family transcriptional regulator [Acuticoccus kandeliae]